MGFMVAQMTEKQAWYEVDGLNGRSWIDQSLVGELDLTQDAQGKYSHDTLEALSGYYASRVNNIRTIELVEGYGVRSSAPGYMDCTEWSVYTSLDEAKAAYAAEQASCDGEEDADEESEDNEGEVEGE